VAVRVRSIAMSFTSLTNLAFPKLVAVLVDGMAKSEPPRRRFLASALLVFAAGAVGSWLRTYLFALASESVTTRLRVELVKRILQQEMAFFDRARVQDLLARVTDDAQVAASAVTANLAKAYRYLNSALGGSMLLFSISPRLTLVALGVVPMVGVSGMLYGMKARKLSKQLKEEVSKTTSRLEEVISNMRTVRLFAKDEHEARCYAADLAATSPLVHASARAEGLFMGGLMFGGYGSLLGVLFYGGTLVAQGKLSVGALTSFAMYSATVGLGFSGLSQVYGETTKALSSAQRVFELLHTAPGVEQTAGACLGKVTGKVEFVGVHFHYPTRPDVAILNGITLRIAPGEVVALAGASGSGKSTMAALLTRLYEPSQGDILLDDRPVCSLSAQSLRQQIAVVNQDPVLFATTIIDNIIYGVSSEGVLDSRRAALEAAAKVAATEANAAAFIEALPEGYHTQCGERGVQLSGGQRQRIAIARALVRAPQVLVLDEATSALDHASEHLVRQALDRLMAGRTSLVIAHRTSTLAGAMRVAVLQDGVIAEEGQYAALVGAGGVLARLVETLPA
jgi:ABC-type multidrug transport system fused ATPase/permease subunit